METQIYLKVYSATGVVEKGRPAKKMTNLYYHDLKKWE